MLFIRFHLLTNVNYAFSLHTDNIKIFESDRSHLRKTSSNFYSTLDCNHVVHTGVQLKVTAGSYQKTANVNKMHI